ncbi:S-type anion channel SLAH1-like [Amaranthus tricolor]|uniref:S-type anion channel SLAH1-like n=1 Tax=Amaranthus tricolor TaxID=29722 RepID=UPI00258465A5|nr:S-type anion channel SLAH1-like [Amaranthus tricolor]
MDAKSPTKQCNSNKASIEITIDHHDGPISSNKKFKKVGLYDHFVSTILADFHAGYFRISLALCAQVLLWKTLVQFTKNTHNPHLHPTLLLLPSTVSTLLWSISLVVLISLSIVYALRCFHHFDKVKAEFLHHVGVNYLFAPWVSCLFLLQTSPFLTVNNGGIIRHVIWWVFVLPIIVLDIKLYGQWFIKGKRFLAKEANPACQHSVIANLVAAKSAVFMGWSEIGLCLFSLGMAHYFVLFVTLYQRLPGRNGFSIMLTPVFFLFIGTPSMGSLAWSSIIGSFDVASKMLFFLSMFLFLSLVSRPRLFQKSLKKFNIAWWAFPFPTTLLALASIGYAQQCKDSVVAQTLALLLSILSMVVSLALMVFTTFKINKLFLST